MLVKFERKYQVKHRTLQNQNAVSFQQFRASVCEIFSSLFCKMLFRLVPAQQLDVPRESLRSRSI